MADFERRPNFQRGFQNNRKRRYRDDDDYDRRPQRRRYEEPLAVKIRKQILSIADPSVRRVEDEVSHLAKTLAENYFDSDLTTVFNDLVVQMTTEQPLKIPFIAAIVLVVNAHKQELAAEVIKKASESLQAFLDDGMWRKVKLMLRFFGCLQGLFEDRGVFALLDELFLRAVDLQTASSEDSLGLEIVKVILFTIPYTMASSGTGMESLASSLLEKTDIIASTPHTLENLVNPFATDKEQSPTVQSTIALLQQHLQEEAKQAWELSCLPRPWKVKVENEDGSDLLQAASKHPFPDIAVPQTARPGPDPIYPEVFFSAYGDQDIETVPSASELAAFLLRDALADTINILDFNRMSTAKFLIDVDCYFAPDTFVKRGTAFDKLRDLPSDKPTWKPEDVAVDAAFSQLFQLPGPEHKLVYYHSVLTEACKIAPAAIAPSLGRAIRFFYRKIDQIDLELSQRFLDWFAHHLSNFGFTWKWTEWVDDVALPDVHPKKAFIVAGLDKEIRLSFAQRIKGTLPEPYQPLISEAKAKDTPDFKFNDPTTPFSSKGLEISQLIRRKAPDTDIAPIIEQIQEEASAENAIEDTLVPSTDVYVTAICFVGSKSLSHVLSCIERCKERLLAIGPQSPAGRRQIITSVLEYWRDQPGVGVNIIDKLLNYTILTPSSVVEWALEDHMERGTVLTKSFVYEMIATTVTKVTNRVRQIVRAVRQPGLPAEQTELLQETLDRERQDMQRLFQLIEDACVSVRDGNNDQMIKSDGAWSEEEEALIRAWGARWLRVFQRKFAVEESWIAEELVKPIHVPVNEVPEEAMATDGLNGNAQQTEDLENGIE